MVEETVAMASVAWTSELGQWLRASLVDGHAQIGDQRVPVRSGPDHAILRFTASPDLPPDVRPVWFHIVHERVDHFEEPAVGDALRRHLGVHDARDRRVAAAWIGDMLHLRVDAGDGSRNLVFAPPGHDPAGHMAAWSGLEARAQGVAVEEDLLDVATDTQRAMTCLEQAVRRIPDMLGLIRQVAAQDVQRAADMSTRLLGLMDRLRHELVTRTQTALQLGKRIERRTQAIVRQAAHAGLRDVHGLARLPESLADTPLLITARERAADLDERSHHLRVSLDAYRESLSAVVGQQQRRFEEASQRQQRVIGYALAALAGLTAIPLLVGELAPEDLQQALAGLPGPLSGLEGVAAAAKPWLALVGMAGGAGLIVVLVVLLTRRARQPGEEAVAVAGKALMELRSHAKLAADYEPHRRRQLPRFLGEEIEEADQRSHDALSQAMSWRRRRGETADERLDDFIVEVEVAARRPFPLPLPRSLDLLAHEWGVGWVSAAEREEVAAVQR